MRINVDLRIYLYEITDIKEIDFYDMISIVDSEIIPFNMIECTHRNFYLELQQALGTTKATNTSKQ